jgi:hypothetical protein
MATVAEAVFTSVKVKPSIVTPSIPLRYNIPSEDAAAAAAVPTPALMVVAEPDAFTIVRVLVVVNTLAVEVLMLKPLIGAVSLEPAARVAVTEPLTAVTPFNAVTKLAKLV